MKMSMTLGCQHGPNIGLYAECNHCGEVLGPFLPDDLMQPERILCECGKSEPIFSKLTFDTDAPIWSVWDRFHT